MSFEIILRCLEVKKGIEIRIGRAKPAPPDFSATFGWRKL